MTALLDTGVLLAAIASNDHLHDICVVAIAENTDLLLPDVVLPELAHMILRDMNVAALTPVLTAIKRGELRIVAPTPEDIGRASELMTQYADARVDFVDCVIVALAERLNITRILTVDRRHFSLFRPPHCAAFELVP